MPGGKGKIRPEDGRQFQKGDKAAEIWTEDIALQLGNDLLEWMHSADENIFWDEFIFSVAKEKKYHKKADIYPKLIPYLEHKFSSFLTLIEKAKKLQEIKLKKFGCFDKLNSSMTKFVLINNHGWADKQEINSNNKGEIIITRKIITDKE